MKLLIITLVYQHGSSHISGGAVRWCYRKRSWSEVTSQEETLTGNDRVRMRNRFRRFLLTIVVQNVPLRITDMATGCDVIKRHVTHSGFPWKGMRMRNRKLRNIRPSGAFSPEITSSNVTW